MLNLFGVMVFNRSMLDCLRGAKLEGCSGSKPEGNSGLAVNLKVTLVWQ